MATADVTAQQPLFEPITISLSDASFQGVGEAVTFRIYSYGHDSASRGYDNLMISGTVVTIPEPVGLSLLAVAGGALLRRRRSAA